MERTEGKVDAIKLLRQPDAWKDCQGDEGNNEDLDDARDVLGVIKRLCKTARNKGKGREES